MHRREEPGGGVEVVGVPVVKRQLDVQEKFADLFFLVSGKFVALTLDGVVVMMMAYVYYIKQAKIFKLALEF